MADIELDRVLESFVLDDPGFIAKPYPVLASLRELKALFRHPVTDQWFLTRFSDIHELLRDKRLGRSYLHRYTHEEFGRPEPDPRWQAFRDEERWSLLELEPPDHTRIRRLITSVFTPRAVNALAGEIERRGTELAQHCRELGAFELLADFARPYSVGVICSMLGVPESDADLLLRWSHAIVKMYELTTTDDQRRAATTAAAEFVAYVKALIVDKRQYPDNLLVSNLAMADDGGERLTADEIVSTVIVLLNAGHEATVNTLGNGMRALMEHRDQWRRLTGSEVEPRTAVEELLRFDAPLQLFERWVLDPGVQIHGQSIPAGSEIAMLFGSAHRDPRRFERPDQFDVGRGDTAHIGFGGGIHFCIGAPLARLEIEHGLRALVGAMPEIDLVEPPSYHSTFVIRGLTALHLDSG